MSNVTIRVPDKVKNMDRAELCKRLGIDWIEATRLQRGDEIPLKLYEMTAPEIAVALDINDVEAVAMVYGDGEKG